MLRDLLRRHPRLESPEETHFFRWADPFGTERYMRQYERSPVMKRHREIDGVAEDEFEAMMGKATGRKHLMEMYGDAFLKARENSAGRWFDKTPQNIYGVLMIASEWPDAKFVHIHRHPLNVVASLLEGAVMPVQDFNGAVNYWLEASMILQQFRHIAGERLLEVKYESLVAEPSDTLPGLLDSLNEDPALLQLEPGATHPEKNKYLNKLDAAQIEQVLARTAEARSFYGYGSEP